jgi:hypothetical protein
MVLKNRAALMVLLGVAAAQAAAALNAAPGAAAIGMKQVQIMDQGMGRLPAVNLTIPADWQFQGEVHWGGGVGGCFADAPAVAFHAQSSDGALLLEGIPNFSWVYADDPAVRREMIQDNSPRTKSGRKPCPILRPARAADFLRQRVIPYYRRGERLVNVDPLPEFDALLRKRRGLADAAAGNQATRIDAARARLAYERNGQEYEEWLTTVVVVDTAPAGRGSAYDCHAVMMWSLRAPKGQLDATDSLFKAIAASVKPEAQWSSKVNDMIAKLYKAQRDEKAKQKAAWNNVGEAAGKGSLDAAENLEHGSEASAEGASQLLRDD